MCIDISNQSSTGIITFNIQNNQYLQQHPHKPIPSIPLTHQTTPLKIFFFNPSFSTTKNQDPNKNLNPHLD